MTIDTYMSIWMPLLAVGYLAATAGIVYGIVKLFR